ncbi:phosphotransferase family protein [Nocardioides sp. CPCC 205120]|uniref:phosphotransferase family protein n=1 Tax=Nocardioides sp. CPCC 205120 TaxID=3406462 RepID=UPI003B50A28A
MTDTDVPGLDPVALTAWWRTALADDPATGLAGDLGGSLVAGGKSNLTYRVGDGTRTWIVRRPPLGHVLATAHDMAREHRVMTALAPTAVPVPATYALCTDDTVLGAPFYVMADVAGTPYRTADQLAPLGPERTRRISEELVDTLAALHAVVPEEVGLADFGRPEGFLVRQVRRWSTQLERSRSRELPAADELRRRLEGAVEEAAAGTHPGIVHGDYRLDNALVDDTGAVAAVIDWEMATLGDTLTDVALMVLYGRLAEVAPGAVADAGRAPGFLDEDAILDRYATALGTDLRALDVHLGLAAFKLAVILEGIHYRHQRGQTVGEGFADVGAVVVPLLQMGLAALPARR